MNNKRVRSYLGVIYEDDENFKTQFLSLKQEKESIWIRHDQDINEETGDYKKPHYHFVIQLKNACTLSALAKRLHVNDNMLEYVKNMNSSLKYLIHYNDDNKYNYEKELVESNSDKLKNRFLDLVSKDTPEVEKVIIMQEFIENYPDFIKISVLSKYAQKHNIWDAFRRNYSIIKDLANEHNAKISGELYGYKYTNPDYYNAKENI